MRCEDCNDNMADNQTKICTPCQCRKDNIKSIEYILGVHEGFKTIHKLCDEDLNILHNRIKNIDGKLRLFEHDYKTVA